MFFSLSSLLILSLSNWIRIREEETENVNPMKNKQIILASSSPRRIHKLQEEGITPYILPSQVEETVPPHMTMEQAVQYLALKKALDAEQQWNALPYPPLKAPVLIAADTVVYQNRIIGKPADRVDAFAILHGLSGTHHFVATGVCLLVPGTTKRRVFYEVTQVHFAPYTDAEIQAYLDTDEPWDKAGAYAIQGAWGKHVSHIDGGFDNVVGFPWDTICKELDRF